MQKTKKRRARTLCDEGPQPNNSIAAARDKIAPVRRETDDPNMPLVALEVLDVHEPVKVLTVLVVCRNLYEIMRAPISC